MANKKRIATTLGAMALTAALAIGGTLAYLSTITQTAENKFTSSKGITGEITETEWEHGKDGWTDYEPGQSTGKNPVITIEDNGTSTEAYVAMKLVCVGADGKEISFKEFQEKYATVSYNEVTGYNTTDWTESINYAGLFLYNTTLKTPASTNPIFDTVTVNTGIYRTYEAKSADETIITYKVDENGKEIQGTRVETKGQSIFSEDSKVFIKDASGELVEVSNDATLPSFEIKATGYAIQKSGNEAIYESELAKLAGYTL